MVLYKIENDQLPQMVVGAVVVLDVDAGTFVTACGHDALRLARRVGARLNSTARQPPKCHIEKLEQIVCSQPAVDMSVVPGKIEWYFVKFRNLEKPRLESVVYGSDKSNLPLIDNLPNEVAAAKCP